MFDADLNDLEMFANSLLKSIEMLRRDYSDVIKDKIKKCALRLRLITRLANKQ